MRSFSRTKRKAGTRLAEGQNGQGTEEGPERLSDGKEFPDCPICGRPVRYMMTAIAQGGQGAPTHFDCVLRLIGENEELQPREKVCYLGNGTFGIIRFKQGGQSRFTIRKRIQYEEKDKVFDWRKRIAGRVKGR